MKKLAAILTSVFLFSCSPVLAAQAWTWLIESTTSTVTGGTYGPVSGSQRSVNRTFQGVVFGSGSVGATIDIEGSNNGTDWITLGTITLSGTAYATDGFNSTASWLYVRAKVSAISGTSAKAYVMMGV